MAVRDASAWLGLGGNQDEPAALIEAAIAELQHTPGIAVRRRSRLYRSPPWGVVAQPEFVNAVAELRTQLAPEALLRALLAVEKRLGRVRDGSRWGPRRIDLDLLTYEDVVLRAPGLTLPHPHMHERAFVLLPLLELEPGFVIPGRGSAAECLQRIEKREAAGVHPLTESKQETTP